MTIDYPNYEAVYEQLASDFAELPVEISTDEIADLSRKIMKFFSEMKKKPYEGFAIQTKEPPCICLRRWQNEDILHERKEYAGDYSTLTSIVVPYKHITIHIVVAWGVKRIELHFVSSITDTERKEMQTEAESIMTKMNINAEDQQGLMAGIMKKMLM